MKKPQSTTPIKLASVACENRPILKRNKIATTHTTDLRNCNGHAENAGMENAGPDFTGVEKADSRL